MPQLSVTDIIKIGDVSTYLSAEYIEEGRIFGDRLSQDMNVSIAMVTDALRWQWAAFPDVPEVRAVGRVTITSLGDFGDNIAVFVNDPELGILQLGDAFQTNEIDPWVLTQILANACASNEYGYQIIYTPRNNYFTIIAREGTGASINNSNNLYVVITPTPTEFITSESGNRFLTQSSTPTINNFITTETY